MSVKRLVPLNAAELSADPAAGRPGDIYYNTADQQLKVFTGVSWIPVGSASETYIHTYDGDIHTVYAGAYNPAITIFDGGTSASQYDETKDIDAGAL